MADLLGKPVRPKSQAELEAEAREAADALAKAKIQALINPTAPTSSAPVAELKAPTLRQPATPVTVEPEAPVAELTSKPKRKAGDSILERIQGIDLTPWEDVEPIKEGPNFYGRNLPDWRAHNQQLKLELNDLKRQREFGKIEERLIAEGYKHDELEAQMRSFRKQANRRGLTKLRQDKYNVSQAAADEQVAKALLEILGAENVVLSNSNPLMGTDLRGDFGDHGYNIDAQQRLSRGGDLFLSVTQQTPGIQALIFNNPDTPLIELLNEYRRDTNDRIEGKLLQTTDRGFNPTPSDKFMEQPESFNKDLLISNARPGRKVASLHDRERPTNTRLIDLVKAREYILPKTYSQLREVGIAPRVFINSDGLANDNELTLTIPKKRIIANLQSEISVGALNEALMKLNGNRRRR